MNRPLGLTHFPGLQLHQDCCLSSEASFDFDGYCQLSPPPVLSPNTRSEQHCLNVLSRNTAAPATPIQEYQFSSKRSGDEAFSPGYDIHQVSSLPHETWKKRLTEPLRSHQPSNVDPGKPNNQLLCSNQDRKKQASYQHSGNEAFQTGLVQQGCHTQHREDQSGTTELAGKPERVTPPQRSNFSAVRPPSPLPAAGSSLPIHGTSILLDSSEHAPLSTTTRVDVTQISNAPHTDVFCVLEHSNFFEPLQPTNTTLSDKSGNTLCEPVDEPVDITDCHSLAHGSPITPQVDEIANRRCNRPCERPRLRTSSPCSGTVGKDGNEPSVTLSGLLSEFRKAHDPTADSAEKSGDLPSSFSQRSLSTSRGDIFNDSTEVQLYPVLQKLNSERELSPDSLFDEAPSPGSTLADTDIRSGRSVAQTPGKSSSTTGESAPMPSATEKIMGNFMLQEQDMLANHYREIFCRLPRAAQYISPYPRFGGPLGYLPSTPGTHVRCIEVTNEEVAKRISKYRRKIQTLQYQRDKFMRASTEWTTIDPATGKTKEQMMKEEPKRLKRALNFQEKKAEEFRLNAELWKGRYQQLQRAYNNLLHQHHVAAQETPNVGCVPYLVPSLVCSIPAQAACTAPRVPSQPSAGPITIDLTCGDVENISSDRPVAVPANANSAESLHSTMRNKSYDWLGDKNHMQRRLQPMQGPPISFVHHLPQLESASVTNHSSPGTSGIICNNNRPRSGGFEDEDDELAQMLQDELERDP